MPPGKAVLELPAASTLSHLGGPGPWMEPVSVFSTGKLHLALHGISSVAKGSKLCWGEPFDLTCLEKHLDYLPW